MPVLWINFVMRSRGSRVVPHCRATDISLGASAAHDSAVASESVDHETQYCTVAAQARRLGGSEARRFGHWQAVEAVEAVDRVESMQNHRTGLNGVERDGRRCAAAVTSATMMGWGSSTGQDPDLVT